MKLPTARMTLWSLWLYLGGPLVWGSWMVWRLGLLSMSDFLACLWPAGAAVLVLFLVLHGLNLRIRSGQALRGHFFLLVAFGFAGTFGFLTLGGALGLPGPWDENEAWLAQAVRGTFVGAAMIALFYPLATTELLKSAIGATDASRLRRWNLVGWFIGVPTWFLSNLFGCPGLPRGWARVQVVLPVVMSGLLLLRLSPAPRESV